MATKGYVCFPLNTTYNQVEGTKCEVFTESKRLCDKPAVMFLENERMCRLHAGQRLTDQVLKEMDRLNAHN